MTFFSEPFFYSYILALGNNSCFENRCTQLCLATPNGHSCSCGDNFTLNEDNRTCSGMFFASLFASLSAAASFSSTLHVLII